MRTNLDKIIIKHSRSSLILCAKSDLRALGIVLIGTGVVWSLLVAFLGAFSAAQFFWLEVGAAILFGAGSIVVKMSGRVAVDLNGRTLLKGKEQFHASDLLGIEVSNFNKVHHHHGHHSVNRFQIFKFSNRPCHSWPLQTCRHRRARRRSTDS